jgi:hypothetical protein
MTRYTKPHLPVPPRWRQQTQIFPKSPDQVFECRSGAKLIGRFGPLCARRIALRVILAQINARNGCCEGRFHVRHFHICQR